MEDRKKNKGGRKTQGISFPNADFLNSAKARARHLGIDLSSYINQLIRADIGDPDGLTFRLFPEKETTTAPNQKSQNDSWYKLKMYGVAAGKPTSGDETEHATKINYGPGHYALEVCGESMEPAIADKSIIIMRATSTLRNPWPKKGLIYDFILNGERTIKRFNTRPATKEEITAELYYENSDTYRVKVLESINPAFPEIVLSPSDEIKMLGWYDPTIQPQ